MKTPLRKAGHPVQFPGGRRVHILLAADQLVGLEALAKSRRSTVTQLIREAVDSALSRPTGDRPA